MTECDHVWTQVGRCVYCDKCNRRVQAKAPKTEAERVALNTAVAALDNMMRSILIERGEA